MCGSNAPARKECLRESESVTQHAVAKRARMPFAAGDKALHSYFAPLPPALSLSQSVTVHTLWIVGGFEFLGAVQFTNYHFYRVHQTLRVRPPMEAGLTDHVWSLEELVGLLENNSAQAVA
jgi:hypothetical protein